MRRRLRQRPPTLTSRVAVRRRMLPWPLRLLLWLALATALVAAGRWGWQLWQQQRQVQQQLQQVQTQLQALQAQQALQQALQDAPPDPGVLAEEATIESLSAQVRALQSENSRLRDELGFYENLLPASENGDISIRNMALSRTDEGQLAWQMLLMRPRRDAGTFKGELQWQVSGQLNGKPWQDAMEASRQRLELERYVRLEGQLKIPKGLKDIQVTALIVEGRREQARHTLALDNAP